MKHPPFALVVVDLVLDAGFALLSAAMAGCELATDGSVPFWVFQAVCCYLAVGAFWRNVERLAKGEYQK